MSNISNKIVTRIVIALSILSVLFLIDGYNKLWSLLGLMLIAVTIISFYLLYMLIGLIPIPIKVEVRRRER